MSAAPRPRRSTANLHPADVLLQDKRPRRSPADVAKEKAALEAQRQAIVEKRAADLHKLALLEEQLKMQDIDGGQQAPVEQEGGRMLTTQDVPESITMATPRRKGRQAPTTSTRAGPPVESDSQHTAATAGSRLKRASRADVDAYRGPAGQGSEVSSTQLGQTQPGMSPMVISPTPKPDGRKPKRKNENAEHGLEVLLPKKGRMTKPSGVTPAAASKFSSPLPSRQRTSVSTTPQAHTQASTPTRSNLVLSSTAAQSRQAAIELKTTSLDVSNSADEFNGAAASEEAIVSVEFGGYVPADNDEAVEQGPRSSNIESHSDLVGVLAAQSTKPTQAGLLTVEVVDVAAASVPKQPLWSASTPVTTRASSPAAALPSVLRKAARHWVMADIEKLLGPYAGSFTLMFLPKLITLIGNSASGPWRLYGVDLPSVMKAIATDVFPTLISTIEPEIVPRRMFYEVAKQKLSEYRNGVAKEALDVVNEYMESRRFTSAEERADFVAWALTNSQELRYPFRYVRILNNPRDGTLEKIDVYQGKLIAYTFSYHLRRTGLRADQFRDYPCNALALATTAVERALRMWETGWLKRPNPRSEEAKFSDRTWGKTASEYLGGITNLTEKQWDGILARAELYTTGRTLDDSDSNSDDSDSNSDPFDLPMAGGRADIDDDRQTAYEAELRGSL